MTKRRNRIYQSRLHLLVTLLIVALPLPVLFFFSKFTHLDLAILLKDIGASIWRMIIAYFISVILAWICAAAFYKGKRSLVALPIFDVLQSFPAFAALPAAILLWGRSDFTIIIFLVVAIIWPVFFSIISSLKLTRKDWEEAVEISQLKGFKYIRHFLWPVSTPGLVTGSIIGLGDGWEAMVATEIIVNTTNGLGNFFQASSQTPRITIFGIAVFLLIIFSINKLVWLPILDWSHRRAGE